MKIVCESVGGDDLLTYDGNVAPALILQELCHELNAINLHKQEAIACCRHAQCLLKLELAFYIAGLNRHPHQENTRPIMTCKTATASVNSQGSRYVPRA